MRILPAVILYLLTAAVVFVIPTALVLIFLVVLHTLFEQLMIDYLSVLLLLDPFRLSHP